MRRFLARLAVLGAFAVSAVACSAGGSSLPFAGPPNNSGGGGGTNQPGGNSTALLRFIQGSPDYGLVDVCVDNLPFGVTAPRVAYGTATPALYAVPGGIAHTISTYPPVLGFGPGDQCPTAPGPFLGTSPISVTTITPGTPSNPARETIVLGGRALGGTLGLYVFGEPSFAVIPVGDTAISHNAAPRFSGTTPNNGIGFGYISGGPPINLPGAQNLVTPIRSAPNAAFMNVSVQSAVAALPTTFFDGNGVLAGPVVPITTVPAPPHVAGQPYVIQLYAIDAPVGGLGLVAVPEQITGYGF